MRIESLSHNGTYWQAVVYLPIPPSGVTITLDRKYGSWQRVEAEQRWEAPDEVAAVLQRQVRTRERGRTRERRDASKPI